MEDKLKLVVFEVDVPERKVLESKFEFGSRAIFSSKITFNIGDELSEWKICCDLNGKMSPESESSVGLFLSYVSGKLPDYIKFSSKAIKNTSVYTTEVNNFGFIDDIKKKHYSKNPGTPCGRYGIVKDLYAKKDDYFPDGKIRFLAKIILQFNAPSSDLHESWAKAFEHMSHSDVIIKTSDKKVLKAHKFVLSARSTVFDSMFTHDMEENRTGIIKISDAHSTVITELLRYIYCNKVQDIASFDRLLYKAADKYQIEGLKVICLQSIYQRINPQNAGKYAEFALFHKIEHLFSCCAFIIYA